MKHYLNVCDVNGAEVEAVDVISFGSPCQDLSLAGKRKGLKHESNGDDETTRSGLFMEAIRIIKEMRKKDEDEQRNRDDGRTDFNVRPRFAVWENVPGAFSSNGGQDFRTVLEELARIKDTEISIPMPENGKWKQAGCIEADGWSIAWRTLDAQFHGVPQRRRRIFLVADFAGQSASEILFECEGLPGYSTQGEQKRKETSGNLADGIGRTGEIRDCGNGRNNSGNGLKPYILQIRTGCEGGGKGPLIQEDKSPCLTAMQTTTLFQPYCLQGSMIGRKDENGPQGEGINEDVAFTLNTIDRHAVAYGISPFSSNAMLSDNPESGIYEAKTSRTLDLNGGNPACNQGGICIVEPIAFRKTSHPKSSDEPQGYEEANVNDTLNVFDIGETRTPTIVLNPIGFDFYNMNLTGDKGKTLQAEGGGSGVCEGCVLQPIAIENHPMDSRIKINEDGTVESLTGRMGTGGGNVPLVAEPICMASGQANAEVLVDKCSTLTTINSKPIFCIPIYSVDDMKMGNTYILKDQANTLSARDYKGPQAVCIPCYSIKDEGFMDYTEDVAATLKARDYKTPQCVAFAEVSGTLSAADGPKGIHSQMLNNPEQYFACEKIFALDRASFNQCENAKFDLQIDESGKAHTLVARGPSAVCYKEVKYIVRRLTPTECARLQGMPDMWCKLSQIEDMSDEDFAFWTEAHKVYSEINGKNYKPKTKEQMVKWYNKLQSDGPEYKAYGNGMALPCVRVPIHGIAKCGAKTMASLFDGIGGFPLAGLLDGIETLWTSEIELFPIAVTMERFREYEQFGGFTFGFQNQIDIKPIENKEERKIKQMELKVNEVIIPERISFNYDELKAELTEKVKMYETMVYTDDQIKEAKADKANLNKLKKALNDERIRREKEYMIPFNEFKAQINEIIGIIDKPILVIDNQVKAYEDKQKQDKKEKVAELFLTIGFQPFITLEKIFDERWLNASTSMKSIEDAMKEIMFKASNDMLTLSNLPEFGFEAQEIYKSTLDINRAIAEAQRMSEIAKAKAEREAEQARLKAEREAEEARLKAEAEAKKQEEVPVQQEEDVPKKESEVERFWISFKANLTPEEACQLKEFFEERHIQFEAI